jgi:hypothetical protein
MWHYFTGPRKGNCSTYGLLLVKDFQQQRETGSSANLASVGATLTDLIPQGAERFVTSHATRAEPRRLMILSGAYPQPGWSVLIERIAASRVARALLRTSLAK